MIGFAVALVAAALGWAVLAARAAPGRRHRHGPSPRLGRSGSLVVRWRRAGSARGADPAPLLRFRTSVERGASVAQAFEAVAVGGGPWGPGARRLVRRVQAGAGVQPAVDAWADEEPDPALGLLADALAISGATGGSHLRAVDAVIDAVRDRAALQREVRALASQAQTSALVLVLLPLAFAVAVAVFDPRVRAFYLAVPVGPLCVFAGLVLDVLGALIMFRLVRAVA